MSQKLPCFLDQIPLHIGSKQVMSTESPESYQELGVFNVEPNLDRSVQFDGILDLGFDRNVFQCNMFWMHQVITSGIRVHNSIEDHGRRIEDSCFDL